MKIHFKVDFKKIAGKMTINMKRGFRNILKLIKSFIKAFHLNVKLTNILSDSKFHPIIGLNFYIPAIAFAWLDD